MEWKRVSSCVNMARAGSKRRGRANKHLWHHAFASRNIDACWQIGHLPAHPSLRPASAATVTTLRRDRIDCKSVKSLYPQHDIPRHTISVKKYEKNTATITYGDTFHGLKGRDVQYANGRSTRIVKDCGDLKRNGELHF